MPTTDARPPILGLLPDELLPLLPEPHRLRYRARQILEWLYARNEPDFAAMTNLPKALRAAARADLRVGALERERVVSSGEGDATKSLFRLEDGERIEAVHLLLGSETIKHTFCVSSQVGCAYGCTFCATGHMGFRRHLTSREIFEQVYRLRDDQREKGAPPERYNVVFMGMGEPLANYDAVVDAIRRLVHPQGLDLGQRRITVSTVGLADRVRRLATEGLRVGLAVSLNATTDEARSKTMPVAKKHGIDELIDAAAEYARKTRRRVTLEYVLLRGENDTPEDAERLGRIAARLPSKVNVIPWNPFPGAAHERGDDDWVTRFIEKLEGPAGPTVTRRTTRGLDIAAACGQLATTPATMP